MHPLEQPTFQIAFVLYFASLVFYGAELAGGWRQAGRLGLGALALGFLVQAVNLGARTLTAGRAPFSNLYESLVVFAWGAALSLLILQLTRPTAAAGVAVVPVIVGALGYASTVNARIEPLMPALQSNWMVFHVAAAILAYGAFAVSFGLGLVYLARMFLERAGSRGGVLDRIPPAPVLDRLIYATIAFAFPFMVLVLITGAVWAQQAWGTYWQWDPKETWALITTLVYAGYLHYRHTPRWRPEVGAWFAVIGFLVVMFCYLGVNLFLSGLHSYGAR
ncbi:MAG TPA: c-type cytochrome biogenesis protein CcsB [Candidatus Nitrosotenuis sp.]|jgi:cytochrome c-type biogenesis protein CcsB|nr:c-type cytochrome biogenesis protein CcsB [Candidatus Nitrosotenuis sp.]